MKQADITAISSSEDFKTLLKERKKLALPIVALIIVFYFGFILLVAFRPDVLARTIGDSPVSIGFYAGLGLLVLSFVLTSVYLRLSDKKIAALQTRIQDIHQ